MIEACTCSYPLNLYDGSIKDRATFNVHGFGTNAIYLPTSSGQLLIALHRERIIMGILQNGGDEEYMSGSRRYGMIVRVMCLALSLAGLIVMARNKELVAVSQGEGEEDSYLLAKYSFVKAFVFLVYANGAVVIYEFLSTIALIIELITRANTGKPLAWLLFLLDQSLTYVLLAAASAASEISYIVRRGDGKLTWGEICSYFDHFCNNIVASIVVTFLSTLGMIVLSFLSARHLFIKYRCSQ